MHVSIKLKNIAVSIAIAVGVFTFGGCKKKDIGPQSTQPKGNTPTHSSVVVLNEGNFMWGNATLSVIDEKEKSVGNSMFYAKNNIPLGDVAQSAFIKGNELFVVLNNSGKIQGMHKTSFEATYAISGFTSPRYCAFSGNDSNFIWVTDLYANSIQIVNLNTRIIERSIPVSGWTETIARFANEMWVLNKKDNLINVFDVTSEQKLGDFDFNDQVLDFKGWSSNEVLVLGTKGIYQVNVDTKNAQMLFSFSSLKNGGKLGVDQIHKRVFVLNENVEMLDLKTQNYSEVLAPDANDHFYGLATNPINGNVYVTNAKDYVQNGLVIQINPDNDEKNEYNVGVSPQFVLIL